MCETIDQQDQEIAQDMLKLLLEQQEKELQEEHQAAILQLEKTHKLRLNEKDFEIELLQTRLSCQFNWAFGCTLALIVAFSFYQTLFCQ